jgi:hypothetical protein
MTKRCTRYLTDSDQIDPFFFDKILFKALMLCYFF